MGDLAIRAEGLSKRYRIGAERSRYRTLREAIISAASAPIRRLTGKVTPTPTIWALKDVSFELRRGEVLGIVGRNGAGKTSLLKLLSRITEPTAGYADVWGRVGSLLEVGTGFHPELTGRENIYLSGAILGMRRREIDRKFDEIVEFAEIGPFLDTAVKRYSSGMYMRLAFSVAAHLEPDILIVDEVLAVGDAAFQKKCLGKMEDVGRHGRTVLLVSHNMEAVAHLCTKAIWLHKGELVEMGDARAVVSHYIQDNNVPLGEVRFSPEDGKHGVYIRRAFIADESGTVRPDVPWEAPFVIGIEYEVAHAVPGLRVGIRLHNERNIAILQTSTVDAAPNDDSFGAPGIHLTTVRIPGGWLAPARYFAELGVWSPGVGHHQHVADGLSFSVMANELDSAGDEVLRPLLPWQRTTASLPHPVVVDHNVAQS